MIVAGIDIGSRTAKALLLKDNSILSYSIISTSADSATIGKVVLEAALKTAGISINSIEHIVATGYGRFVVPFADETVSEISCHSKGANYLFPSVRTILDMGGQDCKAIKCDEKGNVKNFVMNDKCAAGTGRFLEVIAEAMELPLEDIGKLSLLAKKITPISATCAVFAKSEVLTLLQAGAGKEDILAGVCEAVCLRVYALLSNIGIESDFVITGGIAKNIGVVQGLEKKCGLKALSPEEPQIIGALGAALFAKAKCF